MEPSVEELLIAIQARDTNRVREFLARHPGIATASGPRGQRPALLAIYCGADDILRLLRRYGVQLDVFEAAALGDTVLLGKLLTLEPAQVHCYSHDGWTPLHLASHFGWKDAVALLLARGADASARSRNRLANTPLHAAVAGRGANVVALLIAHGGAVNDRQNGGFTALHFAAQHGDRATVEYLLTHGADPQLQSDGGLTAGDLARDRGHMELAALLDAV